jgi:UDP-2,3-diacylglucosamine pyrophosphatase LpxH
MKEKTIIISDIEMGRGDIMDDFTSDTELAGFMNKIVKDNPDASLTLVLNGDIFDFLKMAYKGAYPRHITAEISLWKLNEVMRCHPTVFTALKKFLEKGNNKIHFVIGNHDADLVWPALQETIKKSLGNNKNICFDFWYRQNGLHVEHGHLHDPFFQIRTTSPLSRYRGKIILNTPFGANICSSYLVDLKRKFPHEEKIFPKHLIFKTNPDIKKFKKQITKKIIVRDLLINPFLKFYDPTRHVPYKSLIGHVLRYGTEVLDDQKLLPRLLRNMVKKHPQNNVYVIGHAHLFGKHNYKNRLIFCTDTWRDEYDAANNMQRKPKSYAEITWHNGKMTSAELKTL